MRKTRSEHLIGTLLATSFLLAPCLALANTGQLKPVLKAIDPAQAQVDPGSQQPSGQPPPGTGAINGAPIQPNFNYQPYQPSTSIPTYAPGTVPPTGGPGAALPKGSYPPHLSASAPYPPGTKAPPTSSIAPPNGPPPGVPPQSVPPYGQPTIGALPPAGYAPPNTMAPYGRPSYPPPPPAGGNWGSGGGFTGGGGAIYPPPGPQSTNEEQRVARMEQMAFGSPYPEHEVEDRVEHLEREVFSKAYTEDNLQSRINRLEAKMGGGSAFSHTTPPVVSNPPRSSYPPPSYQPPPTYPPRNVPPQQGFPPVGNMPPQQTFPPVGNMPPQQTFPPVGNMPPRQPIGSLPTTFPPVSGPSTKSIKGKPAKPAKGASTSASPGTTKPSSSHFGGNAIAPPAMPQNSGASEPIMGSLDPANMSANERTNINDIVSSMPVDSKAGDYFSQIQRFNGACARWTRFPVKFHVPQNTPGNWSAAINSAINKWGQFVPTTVVATTEPADVEIAWINHLPPRQLGITNLEIFNGQMRVTVYLLRPTYYLKEVPEKTLSMVALHEIGHSLGMFGHSFQAGDMMQAYDTGRGVKTHGNNISARDINTLRKIYESPSLPSGFQSGQPISWSLTHGKRTERKLK